LVGAIARIAVGLFLLAQGAAAAAQDVVVLASVDRMSLRVNESFTYVLRAEGQVRGDPDTTELEEHFEILQSSSSTRLQIVNGRASQVAEWIYQLMPQDVGNVTIPPIEVAGAFSNQVELEILPAAAASTDVPDDVFLEVEAAPSTAYVQSQVVYTLRLYVGVSTGRATITPPEIVGGEAIVERLGEDRQYQTTLGGREFLVRERRYAIFPQQAGELTVGPATFEAMVIPSRGFSRVQRFRSEPLELTVRPAVPPPAAYANAAWLPATGLTLFERWSDEPSELTVGVPTTRALTIEARGLLETQLPKLTISRSDNLRQYEDQPELNRTVTPDGLIVRRAERYAVLAQSAGETELPGVELPWFNVGTGRWEVAEIAPRRIDIAPGADAPVQQAPVERPAVTPQAPPPTVVVDRGWWPAVAALLAVAWLVTALAWWRSGTARDAVPARMRHAQPRRPANRRLLKAVRTACAHNDAPGARRALLDWAALRFPSSPPRSLGALADRLPERLAAEVKELEASVYGPYAGGEWTGAELTAALSDVDVVTRSTAAGTRTDELLPLYR
jgi:hypothetical protein